MSRKSRSSDDAIANFILLVIAVSAILGGLVLLWWGENQSARYGSLGEEAARIVVEMNDVSKIDPALDGKLVHAVGQAECDTDLQDPLFGFSVKGFTLKRKVRYYQLVEHKEKKKNSQGKFETSYRYKEKWTEKPISSSGFYEYRYRSRAEAPHVTLPELESAAENVRFGAYTLPEFLVSSLKNSQTLKPRLAAKQMSEIADRLHISADLLNETEDGFYIGVNPSTAHLGDVRVSFSYVPISEISILAKVKGNSFERFHRDKDPENVNIGQIAAGAVPAEEMIKDLKSDVSWGAWLLRLGSLILVTAGSFFLPWDDLTERRFVRLIINGSAAKAKEWQLGGVLRFALALLMLTAGLSRLLSGAAATGGIFLAIAAALLFLPALMPDKH
ncbi:hypothetical protein IJT93_09090 [bacterium]|nr:hypothetical protein [bacterium]